MLVITMSGIAAEALEYKKFRSGTATKDLTEALELTEIILKYNNSNIYTNKNNNIILNFSDMFSDPISKNQNYLLNQAYAEAKRIIIKHKSQFYKAASFLIVKKKLLENDLHVAFGSRLPIIMLGNFKTEFV